MIQENTPAKVGLVELAAESLIQDLRQIIEQARGHVAATANYEQTMMYWHIGERINREVLGNQRAEYGKQIVSQVATQLQEEYGKKGFESRNIRRMMQFATLFPEEQIVSQLATKLFWSHFIEVLPLKDSIQREFYYNNGCIWKMGARQASQGNRRYALRAHSHQRQAR